MTMTSHRHIAILNSIIKLVRVGMMEEEEEVTIMTWPVWPGIVIAIKHQRSSLAAIKEQARKVCNWMAHSFAQVADRLTVGGSKNDEDQATMIAISISIEILVIARADDSSGS